MTYYYSGYEGHGPVEKGEGSDLLTPKIEAKTVLIEVLPLNLTYDFRCYDSTGKLKWQEIVKNLIVTQGGNDILTQYFKTGSGPAGWYMGIINNSTAPALTDTATTKGFTEETTNFTGAPTRPTLAFGTAGSKQLATSSDAQWAITGGFTAYGAFVQSASSGTGGVLYSASQFGASRAVVNGDTLKCGLTLGI